MSASSNVLIVIYDKECPFCSKYVDLLQLRGRGLIIEMHNARDPMTFYRFPLAKRFDLDQGMLVEWEDKWFHGADAVGILSTLVTGAPLSRALQKRLIAKAVYSVARLTRQVVLYLAGKPNIRDAARK